MKVVEIRTESDFQGIRPAWNDLLRSCACNTIFLTWEWASTWWSVYGTPGELRIFAVFDKDGSLQGIAPLRQRKIRRCGQTVLALSFVGDGSNDSDYLDFIVAPGAAHTVLQSIVRHLENDLNRGAVLLLNEIPATSGSLAALKAADSFWQETDVACGTVPLPERWEDYLGSLRPRFRTKVRSVLRAIEGRPEVRFGFCEDLASANDLLPALFDLHGKRWARERKPGVFGWDKKRAFYAAMSPVLLEQDWLRFSWMKWNGHVVACQYGFEYGGTYFQLQEGYDPECEHWNPGIALRAWSIRKLLARGVREYDFLAGMGRHKTDWGAETKVSKRIVAARPAIGNVLFCRGPEWADRARTAVRRVVPEKAITACRSAVQPSSSGRAHANGAVSGWMRHAAASCYVHSGFPNLVRSVRERYTVSRGPRGKLSWSRRTEPAGRILYYHRVNNEHDPFCPAITTELFEQEMRFISRHYKVVSVDELVDRLDNGCAEPVVAITFDDGYRDNYENAFPILQRYGLPATIFIATGAIDSQESLWFEQMAEALKQTSREFADLEVDLPRRFSLRTQEERLEANQRIFACLRRLPDTERRERVEALLQQLGAPGAHPVRERMLTWDQVRLMKAHRIDFGGHTVTHPFLSKLTPERVAWELTECKRRIEDAVQSPVDHFAYPNGREEDFGQWNKGAVRAAGYKAALTTIWGVNFRATDRMELRRGQPWEDDAAMFAYKLDWYQFAND